MTVEDTQTCTARCDVSFLVPVGTALATSSSICLHQIDHQITNTKSIKSLRNARIQNERNLRIKPKIIVELECESNNNGGLAVNNEYWNERGRNVPLNRDYISIVFESRTIYKRKRMRERFQMTKMSSASSTLTINTVP